MIKQIHGTILEVRDSYLVIEATVGIGLQVFVPQADSYQQGESLHLFTHLILRENNIALYGFSTPEQETVFKTILGVPSIGAKTALGILSTFSLPELFRCISEGDPEILAKAPGVGKATAKKIHLYLSEKWKDQFPISLSETFSDCYAEAHDLLVEMGLTSFESRSVLQKIRKKGSTASTPEELVEEVLKHKNQ